MGERNAVETGLRAAVIGVGSMGRHHARVYSEIPQTTLAGIADASLDTAQRIADEYAIPVCTDYRELLERERPDIVTVAVSTQGHRIVCQRVGQG